MEWLAWIEAPGLSAGTGALLAGVSFLTSALTAALGLGGGVALLAVMASVMPTTALIPVHGVVQLGSNLGRTAVQRRHVDRTILLWFALGSLVGAVAGGRLVIALPDALLKVLIGAFVIYTAWGPKLKLGRGGPPLFAIGGAAATFLTMFLGATGPFVAALIAPLGLSRHQIVGTHAACMTLQHGLKIVVFGLLGFAFGPWLGLLLAMLAAGFLGTLAGSRLLSALPERTFRLAFRVLLTGLAIKLIVDAIGL